MRSPGGFGVSAKVQGEGRPLGPILNERLRKGGGIPSGTAANLRYAGMPVPL